MNSWEGHSEPVSFEEGKDRFKKLRDDVEQGIFVQEDADTKTPENKAASTPTRKVLEAGGWQAEWEKKQQDDEDRRSGYDHNR
jgi:hypothetical protein